MSVNGGLYYGPDAPFGGYKQSGIGREMGAAGLDEFLERKTLGRAGELSRAALPGRPVGDRQHRHAARCAR